jgi:hypothetical protein
MPQPAPNRNAAPDRHAQAELRERRSQIRALLVLALLAILFSIFRAGVHRVFGAGWWRLW